MVATTAGDDRIVEIVSCRNLLIGDKLSRSSDPYVKVKTAAGRDVHETQHILKTLDPIYSPKHDSLFHLSARLLDDGLQVKVKDWDCMSSDDELGTVEIPPGIWKDASGAPIELHLEAPSKKKGRDAGCIILRCRPAAAYVDDFVQHLRSGKKSSDFPVQGSADMLLKPRITAAADWDKVEVALIDTSADALLNPRSTAAADTAEDRDEATGCGGAEEAVNRIGVIDEDQQSILATEPGLGRETEGEKREGVEAAAAVDVLVEIVSCRNLLVGDYMSNTSDPYVKVKLASGSDEYLHETRHVLKTLDPVFTLKTDSLFRLTETEKELNNAGGLLFKIKDWDIVGSNDNLGTVRVPAHVFKEPSGQRLDFKVTPPSGKESKDAGFITIRCHPTSNHDKKLLQHLKERKKSSDFPGIETYSLLCTSDHITAGTSTGLPSDCPEEEAEKKETGESNIKCFHSWEISWDSHGTSHVSQLTRSFAPTKLFTGKRLVALEVRTVPSVAPIKKNKNYESEEFLLRVMTKEGSKRSFFGDHDGDDKDSDDDGDDDAIPSLSDSSPHYDLGEGDWEAGRVSGFNVPESQGGGSSTIPSSACWKTKYELPVWNLTILNHHDKLVSLSVAGTDQAKEVVFDSDDECNAFCKLLKILKENQKTKNKGRMEAALGSLKIDENERFDLLIEVVSCWDLPNADVGGKSDPFVKVKMGGKEVHRTKVINDCLNPIYTAKHDSFFILSTTAKKLFASQDGLTFEVKDRDAFGRSESLGVALVDARTLYEAKGERLVYKLVPLRGKRFWGKGNIAIRCRHATDHDIEFMRKLKHGFTKESSPMALSSAGTKSDIRSLFSSNTKKMLASDPTEKVKKHKVRPGPDPNRKDETKWMTQAEIQEKAFEDSHNWLDAGSGRLGRIHIEVIGCDNLPNMDSGEIMGNKTDAFVTLVHEDCVVKTDVITDTLSPRWMPWSKRAFIFRMRHSSSQIFVGIFDYDPGFDDHDLIGRVAVDLSTIRPATEYLLH